MTLAIRLCVCIRSQYDAAHMPGKPSVMSDSGNILMTMTNTQEPQNTNTSGALAVAKAAAGLKLYDTASHAVSSFTPIKPGQVGIYVCGATVQSSPHIGHIRAAVAFDVVRRWFERLGYKVTFVRNVTDIDDKILDKAAAAGQQWWERAYIYEREFTEAYSKLGVEPPTYEPRATGHMIDMIDLIKKIIDNGHAYVVRDADGNPTGNVYFDVASWPHYGELTHQKQTAVSDAASEVTDAMGPSVDNAGNDKYNPVDPADMSPDKHDPRDFALWKAPKDSDPLDARWNTPFGTGRPGWHIECSAMSHRYLKDMFDIHGGGLDLRFPHHENEMAQTRAAGYDSAARWMHSAWVTAKGEKMSKSLGNGLSVPGGAGRAFRLGGALRPRFRAVPFHAGMVRPDACRGAVRVRPRGELHRARGRCRRRTAVTRRDYGDFRRRASRRFRCRDERRHQRFGRFRRDFHGDPFRQHVAVEAGRPRRFGRGEGRGSRGAGERACDARHVGLGSAGGAVGFRRCRRWCGWCRSRFRRA